MREGQILVGPLNKSKPTIFYGWLNMTVVTAVPSEANEFPPPGFWWSFYIKICLKETITILS